MKCTTRSRRISLTEDRRAKMQSARSEQIERRRSWRQKPLLTVAHWVVFRLDERNYVVSDRPEDEASWKFYPRLADALTALLHEQISERSRPGLQSLMDAVRSAENAVVATLNASRCIADSLDEKSRKREGEK